MVLTYITNRKGLQNAGREKIMGRIIRRGGQAYEVVDEGRGLVREADFGASVMSEIEVGFPIAFNLCSRVCFGIQKIIIRAARKLRDILAPAEDLEELHRQDADMILGGGKTGFIGIMTDSFRMSRAWIKVFMQVIKYAFIKIKKVIAEKKQREA